MSSVLDLIKRQFNRGKKTFRVTLSEPSKGSLLLTTIPDGWIDAETTYTRSEVYGSVLRNVSTKELTFYKEGRDFIQSVYESTGIDANITMTVQKLDKTDYLYKDYPAANKLDLSTYQVDEIGVTVQVIDTEFKEKLINRDETEVDILKNESIEGLTLSDFDVNELIMPDTVVDNTGLIHAQGTYTGDEYIVIPISSVTQNDFTEIVIPTSTSPIVLGGAFYRNSTAERLLELNGNLGLNAGVGGTARIVSVNISAWTLDSLGVLKNQYNIETVLKSDFVSDEYTVSISQNISVELGDSIVLYAYITKEPAPVLDPSIAFLGDINVLQQNEGNKLTTIKAFPYYEALLKTCQIITDKENCFSSFFFGRPDTPITQYSVEGEVGFVTKGIMFRASNQENVTIPVKLKDLFESLSAIYRIGLGVENDKVVIEELDYFYDDNVILDLSDIIRQEDIKKEVSPEKFYNTLEFGYNSYDYEEKKGLLEFNTSSSWTTVVKSVPNEFSKVSQYRADGEGMRKILNAVNASDYDQSEDVAGDENIFMIKAYSNKGDYIALTNQGYSDITGDVYADYLYNVDYSPARMLRAWGAEIWASLIPNNISSNVKWQTTKKNNTLSSKKTGEINYVTENADIIPAISLNAPRFINEIYNVQAPISTAELQAVNDNPNGLIKLTDTKFGWIQEMTTTNKDGMAEFILIRCNLDKVTPIE